MRRITNIDQQNLKVRVTFSNSFFVLLYSAKEAQNAFEKLKQEPLWNSLPAVKNNKVHFIEDKWNYDDMTTSNMLLGEFSNMLTK
ncbi:hypothetical protein BFM98_20585 [Lysinibacillus sp. AR18-8]|uniref:hypothetical protein n=1 Tax=unclassified Lysinibacillus TaxID=2636778 RepID=UPI000824E076|nr:MULTISPECIES: hypothetical protein [unclassified Lysinibacillus]OCX60487.1 hypothetical protein BFM98_20585 [Lysinibacillus sp. AR18-8]WDU79773.1 hypothetical protein PSR12_01060 [Lysinibacillus sp. G01H]